MNNRTADKNRRVLVIDDNNKVTMNQTGRILIADDDAAFRESLARLLTRLKYECVCAPDSTTTVELLGASGFDLLISDIEMPGNDKLELIRELPRLAPGLPVVLLTGHPSLESAAQSVRLPVVAYLVKPPNSEELRAVVHQSIERYRTYRTVTANRRRLQTWLASLELIELAGESEPVLISMFTDITQRKQAEEQLKETHKQLLVFSRQAGMAEIATNVLHNVGNVLNSVNVTSCCLADGLRRSKVANLSKVVTMLREHSGEPGFLTSDPKGKQLPGYLAQLVEHLIGEQATALMELAQLRKNIEHIKEIVSTQQGYAKVSGLKEMLKITELVEDALRLNADALHRRGVEVVREFEEVPILNVEKHKVLQILVNLVRNATEACDEPGCTEKRLTVRVAHIDGLVKISVIDNGVGIPPNNLARIFQHGFTTRKDGHGFGLHSGALAAQEMGGSLTPHSAGCGQGATFTLELPVDTTTTPLMESQSIGVRQGLASWSARAPSCLYPTASCLFAYLTKPIQMKEFMDTLNASLEFAVKKGLSKHLTQDKSYDQFIGHP